MQSVTENPETRKRRLTFRGRHRGTKENDLLIGRFMTARLEALNTEQLDHFEDLLTHVADADFFNWVMRKEPAPVQYDTDVLQMIRDVNNID